MAFENIDFESLSEAHLQSLIDGGVREGVSIEYKEQLSVGTDEEKKEFLADVSSFANASGGHLVFGISEERDSAGRATGIPEAVVGCSIPNSDAEIRRLENIIRDSIAPRIIGLRCRAIPLGSGSTALVFKVARSQGAPHAITFKGSLRFVSRNSGGKYPLDVQEIRSAFIKSHERTEEIRRFRIERVSRVVAGETPILLPEGPKTILHLIPYNPEILLDPISIRTRQAGLTPLYTNGHDAKINLDGFVTYNDTLATYAQVFRSGAIETVSGFLVRAGERKMIPSVTIEKEIIKAVTQFFLEYQALGISPPLVMMLTIVGVKGYRMAVGGYQSQEPEPIDRQDLFLPEAVVNDFNDSARLLRSIFDALWNSAGWPKSPHYNEQGDWIAPR